MSERNGSGPRIRVLTDEVVNLISAGEVVERPASVVKELLENSLDAGASRIDTELVDGGKRSIVVRDDGRGMSRHDLLLAVQRHATSKISSARDLDTLSSYGFRGEALPSIAAVSHFEITSSCDDGPGHRLRIDGGVLRDVSPASRTAGTTVSVDGLFHNGGDTECWKRLGSHVVTIHDDERGDITGTRFAVWAPNAQAVRLNADFNWWTGDAMQLVPGSGVWALFVEGVGEGVLYKYNILGADGVWREKVDPMARFAEQAPSNASIVYESKYAWADDAWMTKRAQGRPHGYVALTPEMVGRKGYQYVLGKGSGRTAVRLKLKELGIEVSDEELKKITVRVKEESVVRKGCVSMDLLKDIAEEVRDAPVVPLRQS